MSRPHIAILGAGPTGLEAALAALDRGYPFTLYEASSRVAGSIRDWGHVRLFSPWSLDVSPRMARRLEAAGHRLPGPGESEGDFPTGHDLCDRVFEPLARLPELAPRIRTGVRVLEIGRQGLVKSDEIGTGRRAERPFRLLVTADGRESIERADVVLDCTGTWRHPNALGDGGIAAPGESALDGDRLARSIPDLSRDAGAWAGRAILLVGAGHSAQTAVCDLAALAESEPGTRVIWAVRSPAPEWRVDPDDPLPERSRLTARARALAEGASPAVETVTGAVVESLTPEGDGVAVDLRRADGDLLRVRVGRILALTGSVGDHRIYRQLQVHECYATSGPMKLAAALLGSSSTDCLEQESHGADTLVNPEPGFFILGSKSYGRNNTFLMRVGWQQVEEVFGLLAQAAAR